MRVDDQAEDVQDVLDGEPVARRAGVHVVVRNVCNTRDHCAVCYHRDNFFVFLESIFGIYGMFWKLLYRRTVDYGMVCMRITVALMVMASRLLTAVFMFLSASGLSGCFVINMDLYRIWNFSESRTSFFVGFFCMQLCIWYCN